MIAVEGLLVKVVLGSADLTFPIIVQVKTDLPRSNLYPFNSKWVQEQVESWCQHNCEGDYHLGPLENVYFANAGDATHFLCCHLG